jgi:uncharacterized spore protein YtfJ
MSSVIDERHAAGYAAATADQTLDRVARAARPDVVFGQPVERGDTTIIPCCEVALGMGMGGGSGTNPSATGIENRRGEGIGAGGGAGGRPVAVIVLSRNGRVHVQPIVDATKVGLAALTTAGFALFWLAQLTRATRTLPSKGPSNRAGPTRRDLAKMLRR